jgi:redox-sensitive bicupin YhaK (pirin superfamily)
MEGAGVQICRTVGTATLRNLDPYLMLDELRLPAKAAFAGFPDHPHRCEHFACALLCTCSACC